MFMASTRDIASNCACRACKCRSLTHVATPNAKASGYVKSPFNVAFARALA